MDEIKKTINKGKSLADYISEMDYGTIIHYQEIEHVTGELYGSSRYYQAIAKAKKLLIEVGKAIKFIGNKDYQILYPKDYSSAYTREVKIAKNHINRGGKILKNAPVSEMTAEERMTFTNVCDFHKRMKASINGSYVEVKQLSEHKHPLNIAINK